MQGNLFVARPDSRELRLKWAVFTIKTDAPMVFIQAASGLSA
jgi:hypothetical protein